MSKFKAGFKFFKRIKEPGPAAGPGTDSCCMASYFVNCDGWPGQSSSFNHLPVA